MHFKTKFLRTLDDFLKVIDNQFECPEWDDFMYNFKNQIKQEKSEYVVKELVCLEEELDSLNGDLKEKDTEIDRLLFKIGDLEEDIEIFGNKIDVLTNEVEKKDAFIAELQTLILDLEDEISKENLE
jgi:chromosome segregation ATPase